MVLETHFANLNDARWYVLEKKRKEVSASEAFERLREFQIEPILIKGLAAARWYPPSVPRYFADLDLAVSCDDYVRVRELQQTHQLNTVPLDLHRELRHLDSVPWVDLVSNSQLIDIDGVPVRVLRPEDHLRVMCVHWLTDGGANKQRLWDIYYAVCNRPKDFNWDRCLDIVSEARRKWIITAIALAHYYLELDVEDLPFRDEIQPPTAWIQRCLKREWNSRIIRQDLPLLRLFPKLFFQQVIKRIPPNPISATIECEGKLGPRLPVNYQARVLYRFINAGLSYIGQSLHHPRPSNL